MPSSCPNCPSLEEVSLSDTYGDDPPPIEGNKNKPAITFPALKSLHIHCHYLGHAILIESGMPSLQSLTAHVQLFSYDLGDVTTRLVQSPCLTQVSLDFDPWYTDHRVDDALKDLSKLARLQTLELTGNFWPTHLTDEVVDTLARSLPQLQALDIALFDDWTRRWDKERWRVLTTGKSLISLVYHCRLLRELKLFLDLAHSSDKVPDWIQPATSLAQLSIYIVELEDVEQAARFLAASCPLPHGLTSHTCSGGLL